MIRCVCCRQEWPEEFFPMFTHRGREYRRRRCLACRRNCHGTHYAAVKAYRRQLRADVDAIRARRAS